MVLVSASGQIAEDRECFGDEGVLADVLPTLNQIHGQFNWTESLKRAGLHQRREAGIRGGWRSPQGMAVAEAMALYAALNDRWPSQRALILFARDAGFPLQNTQKVSWAEQQAEATALLRRHGVKPPTERPKALGRGRRLAYRYPKAGVPGAPPRSIIKEVWETARSPEVLGLRHELAVIALRVWLAQLQDGPATPRASTGSGGAARSGRRPPPPPPPPPPSPESPFRMPTGEAIWEGDVGAPKPNVNHLRVRRLVDRIKRQPAHRPLVVGAEGLAAAAGDYM